MFHEEKIRLKPRVTDDSSPRNGSLEDEFPELNSVTTDPALPTSVLKKHFVPEDLPATHTRKFIANQLPSKLLPTVQVDPLFGEALYVCFCLSHSWYKTAQV